MSMYYTQDNGIKQYCGYKDNLRYNFGGIIQQRGDFNTIIGD